MTSNPATLAQRASIQIRRALAERRLTGLWLAGQIGRSQNYTAKRLRDEAPFDLNDLERTSQALHIDVADLLQPDEPD